MGMKGEILYGNETSPHDHFEQDSCMLSSLIAKDLSGSLRIPVKNSAH